MIQDSDGIPILVKIRKISQKNFEQPKLRASLCQFIDLNQTW